MIYREFVLSEIAAQQPLRTVLTLFSSNSAKKEMTPNVFAIS